MKIAALFFAFGISWLTHPQKKVRTANYPISFYFTGDPSSVSDVLNPGLWLDEILVDDKCSANQSSPQRACKLVVPSAYYHNVVGQDYVELNQAGTHIIF